MTTNITNCMIPYIDILYDTGSNGDIKGFINCIYRMDNELTHIDTVYLIELYHRLLGKIQDSFDIKKRISILKCCDLVETYEKIIINRKVESSKKIDKKIDN